MLIPAKIRIPEKKSAARIKGNKLLFYLSEVTNLKDNDWLGNSFTILNNNCRTVATSLNWQLSSALWVEAFLIWSDQVLWSESNQLAKERIGQETEEKAAELLSYGRNASHSTFKQNQET